VGGTDGSWQQLATARNLQSRFRSSACLHCTHKVPRLRRAGALTRTHLLALCANPFSNTSKTPQGYILLDSSLSTWFFRFLLPLAAAPLPFPEIAIFLPRVLLASGLIVIFCSSPHRFTLPNAFRQPSLSRHRLCLPRTPCQPPHVEEQKEAQTALSSLRIVHRSASVECNLDFLTSPHMSGASSSLLEKD
jgi:hypothetical protein